MATRSKTPTGLKRSKSRKISAASPQYKPSTNALNTPSSSLRGMKSYNVFDSDVESDDKPDSKSAKVKKKIGSTAQYRQELKQLRRQLQAAQKRIVKLKHDNTDLATKVENVTALNAKLDIQLTCKNIEFKKREKELLTRNQIYLRKLNRTNVTFNDVKLPAVDTKDNEVTQIFQKVFKLEESIEKKLKSFEALDSSVDLARHYLDSSFETIALLLEQSHDHANIINELNDFKTNHKCESKTTEIKEDDGLIDDLKHQLTQKETKINELESKLETMSNENLQLSKIIHSRKLHQRLSMLDAAEVELDLKRVLESESDDDDENEQNQNEYTNDNEDGHDIKWYKDKLEELSQNYQKEIDALKEKNRTILKKSDSNPQEAEEKVVENENKQMEDDERSKFENEIKKLKEIIIQYETNSQRKSYGNDKVTKLKGQYENEIEKLKDKIIQLNTIIAKMKAQGDTNDQSSCVLFSWKAW